MVKINKQTLDKPVWLKYNAEEIEKIILKLADKDMSSEKIGLVLRDQYGIPKVKIYNLKIGKILKDNNIFSEPSQKNLKVKVEKIINHYKKNKQDKNAERSLIITKAKLKKINDYLEKKKNKS